MSSKILDNFTWGFELEGNFSKSLLEVTNRNSYCTDGSVDVYYDESELGEQLLDAHENYAEEYRSPVFDKFENMIEHLELFKEQENYVANDTCGLHVHFKPKNKTGIYFRSILASFDALKKLYDMGKELDSTQRTRLRQSDYCDPYPDDMLSASREWYERIKYRFIRNHPSGTTEFRLFSPVGKKEERVRKFFKSMIEILRSLGEKSIENVAYYYPIDDETVVLDKEFPMRFPPLNEQSPVFQYRRTVAAEDRYRQLHDMYTAQQAVRDMRTWRVNYDAMPVIDTGTTRTASFLNNTIDELFNEPPFTDD